MNTLFFLLNLIGAALVGLLTAHYFYDGGAGLPYLRDIGVHDYIYYAAGIGVFLIPAFWAVTHICGGIFFGIAAGGLLDGMKLGLILGFGMALAKCWPAVLAAALGVYLGGGPLIYTVLGAVAGVMLIGLDKTLGYFWNVNRPVNE